MSYSCSCSFSMAEGRGSSTGLNSVELGQDGVSRLSPEDIVWADSCLSKDLDISDCGWNSLKDALLETLDAQKYSSPYERETPPEEDKMEIFSSGNTGYIHRLEEGTVVSIAASSEGADSVEDSHKYAVFETLNTQSFSSPYDTDKSPLVLQPPVEEIPPSEDINNLLNMDSAPVSFASTTERPEPNSDDSLNHENTEDFWSKHKMEDVFLPTYNENLRDLGISDPEVDFIFQEFQSTEDIFKIWDFDIPPEENDLMKQLNRALSEISMEPTPPVSDDYETVKVLQDESLDDLISAIEGLALTPKSD